ncbi:MAG: hypothetical protein ABJD07_05220, partial [Gemmatimonadaceae bacterium]
INVFSQERRYGPVPMEWPRGMDNVPSFEEEWQGVHDAKIDSPLMTAPDRVDQRALGNVAYRKPGLVMLLLRDHVIGEAAMDKAMRTYVERWAYKHPTPADWFRTVEDVSGQDLAWYWRAFWYGADVLDLGIESVTSAGGATHVVLGKHTSIPFPIEMRLKLADGSTQDVKLPVTVWAKGDRYEATIDTKSTVVGARLWPNADVPDFNQKNDTWGDVPARDPVRPATTGGLTTPIGAGQRP